MSYILLDESGDLGFRLQRGSSKFFIVTIIFTNSKRPLEKIARSIHEGLQKKFKKVGILHAYKEDPITRIRVLKKLGTTDYSSLAIVLNKRNVYTKLQDEKAILYNYVANILLKQLFTKKPILENQPITLIASRKETNKFLNQNFKNYLRSQIKNNHKIDITIEIATPQKEKSLQIVDFVSWAIFRKYEFGDETYYNLIKSNIAEEIPMFP